MFDRLVSAVALIPEAIFIWTWALGCMALLVMVAWVAVELFWPKGG